MQSLSWGVSTSKTSETRKHTFIHSNRSSATKARAKRKACIEVGGLTAENL